MQIQDILISALISAISVLLGILGSYIFFRMGLNQKDPCYHIESDILIQDGISQLDGLEIKYQGNSVDTLTVSKLFFWNNGKEGISFNDISQNSPLRISLSSRGRIFRALPGKKVGNSKYESLQGENGSYIINFDDFINGGHGVVIEVVHSGEGSDCLGLSGSIKGATIRRVYANTLPSSKLRELGVFARYTGLVLVAISVTFVARLVQSGSLATCWPGYSWIVLLLLISLVAFILPVVIILPPFLLLDWGFKGRIPKSLLS